MQTELATFLRTAFLVVAALLPIINPPGGAPIFLSMTAGLDARTRRTMATRISINAMILLVVAMFIGSYVLAFFGISLMAVRLGGGLLVMASGWKLLNSDEPDKPHDNPTGQCSESHLASQAFYPLTFPLMVGPGSISIAVALGATLPTPGVSLWMKMLASLTAIVIVSLTVYLSLRSAPRLLQYLGATGMTVLLRMSAFILLCVGVQIVLGGIEDFVKAFSQPGL